MPPTTVAAASCEGAFPATLLSGLPDLRMTVRGGREEVEPTISPPATWTIRIPAPGTLTSFTGTIRPVRSGACGALTASPPPPGPLLLTTITGGRICPARVSVSRPGGPSAAAWWSLPDLRRPALITAGSVTAGFGLSAAKDVPDGLFSPFFKVIMLQSGLVLLLLLLLFCSNETVYFPWLVGIWLVSHYKSNRTEALILP